VITGGNSGIGLATAREFKANGASVVIFGRSRKSLDQAATSLGGDLVTVEGDVRNLGDLGRLFKLTGDKFGKIDVLVANAGIAKFAPVESLSEELFDELCDTLFKGVFFTVQRALPHLWDGASVILISTAEAPKEARVGNSIYLAAKAAVRALAKSMSIEFLPRRIRVNTVSPGMTETPIIYREGGLPGGLTPEQVATAVTGFIPLAPTCQTRRNGQSDIVSGLGRLQLLPRVGAFSRRRAATLNPNDAKENDMPDLHHHIQVNASPDRVHAAIAPQEGMRSWWTVDTQMDERVGGKAEFGFNKRATVFRMKN
jgi:NAD(P)-dependent dehydrogenase (short-subunit alcohol dehydrogenase family)